MLEKSHGCIENKRIDGKLENRAKYTVVLDIEEVAINNNDSTNR